MTWSGFLSGLIGSLIGIAAERGWAALERRRIRRQIEKLNPAAFRATGFDRTIDAEAQK